MKEAERCDGVIDRRNGGVLQDSLICGFKVEPSDSLDDRLRDERIGMSTDLHQRFKK